MRRTFRLTGTLIMVALFATATYAFTAQNSVDSSNVGVGSGQISGYTLSNIEYTLFSGSPNFISGVEFDLDNPATTVNVRFPSDAGGTGTWRSCFELPANSDHWICSGTESLESVTELEVAAAQ